MLQLHGIAESGYLAHAPDESTTATCALDNGTRGLASSIILTRPRLDYDFDLELTVAKTACMHAIIASYVRTRYLTRGQQAKDNDLQLLDTGTTELSRRTTTVEKIMIG